jgi:hypothetical protein
MESLTGLDQSGHPCRHKAGLCVSALSLNEFGEGTLWQIPILKEDSMMCEEKNTTLLPYPCSERDLVVSSVSHLFWFFSPGLNKKKRRRL